MRYDFLARRETLRAADMSNAKTNTAAHNEKELSQLLNGFAKRREDFIRRLRSLDDLTQQTKALHPRLRVLMKPVDLAFFTAEHDDHHLASIRLLINSLP